MSEGSFWPKTFRDAMPLAVWGILAFAAGLEGVVSVLDAAWTRSVLAFILCAALTMVAVRWEAMTEWTRQIRPVWLIVVAVMLLLLIALSPFVERKRWPFS